MGKMKLLSRQITRRFQVSADAVHPIFADLTTEQLEELGEIFIEAKSWVVADLFMIQGI